MGGARPGCPGIDLAATAQPRLRRPRSRGERHSSRTASRAEAPGICQILAGGAADRGIEGALGSADHRDASRNGGPGCAGGAGLKRRFGARLCRRRTQRPALCGLGNIKRGCHAGAKGLAAIGDDLFELAEELRFTPYLESFVDTLSLGTRQKLAVLLALVGDPLLIVLDEAFNGLDPASALLLKRHLRARLQRRGAALLLATHSLDIVEHYADRAAVLIDGKLKHEWPKDELQRLRDQHGDFEAAVAQAMGES
jgi:hypothetical protein